MNFNNTWKQFLTESRFDFGVLKPKEVLNPVLWAKGHPSPKIIKRLMEISGDILKKLRVDVEVEDFDFSHRRLNAFALLGALLLC